MINYTPDCQLKIGDFTTPFQASLSTDNRWVALAAIIPWDQLAEVYYRSMAINKGRKSLSARIVIGALIIKHMLNLSDRETLVLISENPYMQYFLGLSGFQAKVLFDASLFVKIRERMGEKTFDEFNTILIQEAKKLKPNKKQRPQKKASATSNGTETSLETSPSTLEAENKLELEIAKGTTSQGSELAKAEKAFVDGKEADQKIAQERQEQEQEQEQEEREQVALVTQLAEAIRPTQPPSREELSTSELSNTVQEGVLTQVIAEEQTPTNRPLASTQQIIKAQAAHNRRATQHDEEITWPSPLANLVSLEEASKHVESAKREATRKVGKNQGEKVVEIDQEEQQANVSMTPAEYKRVREQVASNESRLIKTEALAQIGKPEQQTEQQIGQLKKINQEPKKKVTKKPLSILEEKPIENQQEAALGNTSVAAKKQKASKAGAGITTNQAGSTNKRRTAKSCQQIHKGSSQEASTNTYNTPPIGADVLEAEGVDDLGLASNTPDQQATRAITEEPAQMQEPKLAGKLRLDATVADIYITYPTDLDLLHKSRMWSEKIIDHLHKALPKSKKPRTYRRVARQSYLTIAKKKRKSSKELKKWRLNNCFQIYQLTTLNF